MSSDFKKVLVKDDRLMVTNSLNYGVFQGGQNVTYVKMPAVSVSNNALNFVVPFPSEQTVLDREVYLATTTEYNLTFSAPLPGIGNGAQPATWQSPLIYGYNLSLKPFPTHQTLLNIISQINNNISTMNVQDVIPALLRSTDCLDWERTNLTASQNSRYGDYNVALNSIVNTASTGYEFYQGNKVVPNASFTNKLYATDATFTPIGLYPQAGSQYFKLVVTSYEPLMCQPFIWNKTLHNKAGIYGLQNLQFTMNYGSDPGRALALSTVGLGQVSLSGVQQNVLNAELHMKYITPHTTDIVPKRNVIPYLEYPRFITSNLGDVPAGVTTQDNGTGVIINPGTSTLASQTFTLNQVPDKLIIFVRPAQGTYLSASALSPDNSLAITGVRIQWNNHTALLANTTQDQLFHISQEAGYNSDWLSWSGVSSNRIQNVANNNTTVQYPTVGSMLMIDVGKHLELAEPYYAPGSLGTFQIQFNLDVANYFSLAVTPEIVMIPVNSGIMVNEKGQTSVFTGILTKQDVLDASQQEPLGDVHVKRIVGNGMLDGGRALPHHILPGAVRKHMESSSGSGMAGRLM